MIELKKILLIAAALFAAQSSFATHLVGGSLPMNVGEMNT